MFPCCLLGLLRETAMPKGSLQMSLVETAHHFLDMFWPADLERLRSVCMTLDGETIRVGSTCSGLETAGLVLRKTCEALNSRFGTKIQVRTCFAAELHPEKREFIVNAHAGEIDHVFQDVAHVSAGSGPCDVCGKVCKVPTVDVMVSGPACTSISGERSSNAEFADCYKTGSGASGFLVFRKHTHVYIYIYIRMRVCFKPSLSCFNK